MIMLQSSVYVLLVQHVQKYRTVNYSVTSKLHKLLVVPLCYGYRSITIMINNLFVALCALHSHYINTLQSGINNCMIVSTYWGSVSIIKSKYMYIYIIMVRKWRMSYSSYASV